MEYDSDRIPTDFLEEMRKHDYNLDKTSDIEVGRDIIYYDEYICSGCKNLLIVVENNDFGKVLEKELQSKRLEEDCELQERLEVVRPVLESLDD